MKMELAKIGTFNWEVEQFLSNLTTFRNSVNTTNESTLHLLECTVNSINDLINSSATVNVNETVWPPFDKQSFSVEKSFYCQVCKISLPTNYREYILHVNSDRHKAQLATRSYQIGTFDDHQNHQQRSKKRRRNTIVESPTSEMEVLFDEASNKRARIENSNTSFESLQCFLSNPFVTEFSNGSGGSTFGRNVAASNGWALNEQNARSRSTCRANRRVKGLRKSKLIRRGVAMSDQFDHVKQFFDGDLHSALAAAIDSANRICGNSSYKFITESVADLLKNDFQSMVCHLIGSRVNGTTADHSAPLDIYLELGVADPSCNEPLVTSVRSLLEASMVWKDVKQSVTNTRLDVVTATHVATRMNCRFMFDNGGELVKNNDAIQKFFDAKAVCRPLVLLIRCSIAALPAQEWTKKFSGYMISLLVIFYLQATKKFPAAKDLENLAGIPSCSDHLSALVIGFFEFYSEFDFNLNIVSPFEGQAIHQNIRNQRNRKLPASVAQFKEFLQYDQTSWKRNDKMCIQDVYLHSNNVAVSLQKPDVKAFKKFCSQSFRVL